MTKIKVTPNQARALKIALAEGLVNFGEGRVFEDGKSRNLPITCSVMRPLVYKGLLVETCKVGEPWVLRLTEQGRAVAEGLALGQHVAVSEIAELAAFLASDRCPSLTGSTIDLNGASYIR